MEDEGTSMSQVKAGNKRPINMNVDIPSSNYTVTDDETEEEEEMDVGSDDGSWEYVLESLRSKLRSTPPAAFATEEAPGSPYFVDLSEYPPNTDIYSEQHWDWEKKCCVARVPRWARCEYAEMNAMKPTMPDASHLEDPSDNPNPA